jgi:hypothetical protein
MWNLTKAWSNRHPKYHPVNVRRTRPSVSGIAVFPAHTRKDHRRAPSEISKPRSEPVTLRILPGYSPNAESVWAVSRFVPSRDLLGVSAKWRRVGSAVHTATTALFETLVRLQARRHHPHLSLFTVPWFARSVFGCLQAFQAHILQSTQFSRLQLHL